MTNNILHPRPDFERTNWLCLNGEWDFRLFPEGDEEQERSFALTSFETESYDQKIVVPFSWGSPLSGVKENAPGVGWYRTTVEFITEERVFLCFGAVDYVADVFVNGQFAAHHQGGYTQFEVDVTEFWTSESNTITVRTEDYRRSSQMVGKQYTGECQGIWQTVWLEARPQEYIQSFKFVTKCTGDVELVVYTNAANESKVTASFGSQTFQGIVQDGTATVHMHFDTPKLWSPDSPYLYEGEIALTHDRVKTYFGIREIKAEKIGGRSYQWITLNNKPIYLNAVLDQAFHQEGYFTYPTDESMRDEAWRVKRLGLNTVRIHMKHELPRKLYWMDRLGVMVLADIPAFFGAPSDTAKAAFEEEWPAMIERDFNHPSLISWMLFNESWGLHSNKQDDNGGQLIPKKKRKYLPETQEWVRSVYRRTKKMDPTRLVDDNSATYFDHVETDINTWHFYIYGYTDLRNHLSEVIKNTYPGSRFNFVGNNAQTDAPLLNAECGMAWGVEYTAGDSDLSWQYHYMINEFRLHDKLCGFIYTELHDTLNEADGYYHDDDRDRDWGYQDMCRGMSLRDLHAPDFLAVDCPPCRTMGPGEMAAIPLVLSSYSDAHHTTGLTVCWELWHDGLDGRVHDAAGELSIPTFDYGVTTLPVLNVRMPNDNAVAVLSLYLKDVTGNILSRNFTTFNVCANLPENVAEWNPAALDVRSDNLWWRAHNGQKLSVAGAGVAEIEIELPKRIRKNSINGLTLFLEAGAKRLLKKDDPNARKNLEVKRDRVHRDYNPNSYFMSAEDQHPSELKVCINGEEISCIPLQNDWSDCRGVLSFHNQDEMILGYPHGDLVGGILRYYGEGEKDHRHLDEMGSYGELIRIEIPSRLIPYIAEEGRFKLELKAGEGGVAIYGRQSGRYPIGIVVRSW